MEAIKNMGTVKNVQRGVFVAAENFDDTQTFQIPISPVNTGRALLVTHVSEESCRVKQITLSNSSTISVQAQASGVTSYNRLIVSWQVVEYL